MNSTNAAEQILDPRVVIRKAKDVEAIAHPASRRFYAKLLQNDVQKAIAFNHSRAIQAVHDSEHYAFELGRIAQTLQMITEMPDEVES